jgi:hypothetical protein
MLKDEILDLIVQEVQSRCDEGVDEVIDDVLSNDIPSHWDIKKSMLRAAAKMVAKGGTC